MSSSRTAGPAQPGLRRRPAQTCVGSRPALPGGDSELCRSNSDSCCLDGSAGRPGLAVRSRSGTRCDSIRIPDRGGKRGRRGLRRGRGRGGEGRGGDGGKQHGQLKARAVAGPLQGPQGSSAFARTELRWRAHRAKQVLTQSCAGMRAEPHPHTRRATPARAQSQHYACTHREPRQHAGGGQTCFCTSNRAVHEHTIIHQQIEEISELAEG
jgi:hypothetical protein